MSAIDSQQEETGKVRGGARAPDFTLASQFGASVRLSELIGTRIIVLYFYPADNTGGCTAEACSFRDSYDVFTDAGAEVIGVSADSVDSHQGFAAKHRLPFQLLSDTDRSVSSRYGITKKFGLIPDRVTFVIDKQGIVRHVFSGLFQATKHVDEALQIVRELTRE